MFKDVQRFSRGKLPVCFRGGPTTFNNRNQPPSNHPVTNPQHTHVAQVTAPSPLRHPPNVAALARPPRYDHPSRAALRRRASMVFFFAMGPNDFFPNRKKKRVSPTGPNKKLFQSIKKGAGCFFGAGLRPLKRVTLWVVWCVFF